MRIFLFGWCDTQNEHVQIVKKLQEQHEIVYWVSATYKPQAKNLKFPGTIFHNHYDAWSGLPAAGVSYSKFPPPGADLIQNFCRVESLIMSMMNKRFDWLGVDERRHLYYNLLQYWNGVLRKYKPDAIIFKTIPHTVYDYLVYELAQTMSIKTVMFDTTHISDRALVLRDFRKGSQYLLDKLAENEGKQMAISDLSADLQEYYRKQTNPAFDATPLYTIEDKKKNIFIKRVFFRLKIAGQSVLDGSIIKKTAGFIVKVLGENIKKEYASVQTKPDFDKPFIYIPLNYQPECSTSPQGDIFTDLRLMIEIVAAALPDDWVIYVKEHPSQWFPRGLNYSSVRYRGYYRKIAALKNVYIIPGETDSYFLINKAKAVATVTGTAGWETLLRSRPAIIFGHPWYQNCPSLLRARDVESCRRAMEKIRDNYQVNQSEIVSYLTSLDQAAIYAYLNEYGQRYSRLTEEENAHSIARAILAELAS